MPKLKAKVSYNQVTAFLLVALLSAAGTWLLSSTQAARRSPQGTCSYANGVVSATGLPTDQVINFFETNNSTGTQTGHVLGFTTDGVWTVSVTPPTASTTYDFTSRTWGKNGSRFNIFAECSS